MIEFSYNGPKVVVTLRGAYPIDGSSFTVEWNTGSEWAAVLLTENLRNRFDDNVRRIKETAYNAGWKEGRSHRGGKRLGFSGKFSSAPEAL